MCSQIISELNLGFSQQNPVLKTATCLTENETEELQLQAAPVLLLRPPLAGGGAQRFGAACPRPRELLLQPPEEGQHGQWAPGG